MTRSFFIVVALITLVFVLCQLSVFRNVRRYVFARYSRLSLKNTALVFAGLLLINLSLAYLSMNSNWASADTQTQKIVAVTFFTYLGVTFAIGVFLLILKSLYFTATLTLAGYRLLLILVSGDLNGSEVHRNNHGKKLSDTDEADHHSSTDAIRNPSGVIGSGVSKIKSGRFSLLSWPVSRLRSKSQERRARLIAVAILLTFSFGGIYGVMEAYSEPQVEQHDIRDVRLQGLEKPIRLIHVTDIHYGMFYDKASLEGLVKSLNSIEADAVLLTGDIFHSPMTNVESAPEVLKKLRSRKFGNFAIFGNHEFYTGEKRCVSALQASGLTLLRDEWVSFHDGSGAVHLAGLDDPRHNWLWGHRFPNFEKLMEKAPLNDGYRILLSHRPAVFSLASQSGFDLILAGHTHGGQVIVPMPNSVKGFSLASLASTFTHGWYFEGAAALYLNRGAGLTFIPWRINCSPEISVFTLHPA